ncbi:hypothetical protein [Micromonospora sp. NPDC005652]|uniref:hypothetical protein n=1 Tax=Micromonospora sp. NPDC005652 TaxID=3157046 RepID=UPI003405A6BA
MITIRTTDGAILRDLDTTLVEVEDAIRDPNRPTLTLVDTFGAKHLIVTAEIASSSETADPAGVEWRSAADPAGVEWRSAADVILLFLNICGPSDRQAISYDASWGQAGWSSYPNPSTVTNALSTLSANGLIEQTSQGVWQITEKGADVAKEMRPL